MKFKKIENIVYYLFFIFIIGFSLINLANGLPYWRENESIVWTKINLTNNIPIKLYIIENSSSKENGNEVFIYFDDFSNDTSANWELERCGGADKDLYPSLKEIENGKFHVICTPNNNNEFFIRNDINFLENVSVDIQVLKNTSYYSESGICLFESKCNSYITSMVSDAIRIFKVANESYTTLISENVDFETKFYDLNINKMLNLITFNLNNSINISSNDNTFKYIKVGLFAYCPVGNEYWYDNFRVRKNLDGINITCFNNKCTILSDKNITDISIPLTTSYTNNITILFDNFIYFDNSTDLNNSEFFYNRNHIFIKIIFHNDYFNYTKINLYKNDILINESYNFINNEFQEINFTNLTTGIYYFNATICDIFSECISTETRQITIMENNNPIEVSILNPECNKSFTIQKTQNTTIFFNWTNSYDVENESIYYKLYIYNGINKLITNYTNETFYNYSFLYLFPSNYYTKIYSCDALNCSISVSECSFNICINNWTRMKKPCVDGLRLIEYYDINNCNEKYDFPYETNGTYEDCIMQPSSLNINLSEIQIILIILFILIVISIIIGFKYSIAFYFTSFLFGLLTFVLISYEMPQITYFGSIIMTLLFILIGIFKRE